MFQKWIREYLTFSAGERKAVLILLTLVVLLAVLPYIVPVKQPQVDPKALAEFQREIALLKPVMRDTARRYPEPVRRSGYTYRPEREPPPPPAQLFPFDPNTLPEQGWIKLGVAARTARTIRNYCEKGGKFRKPEDIGKIYSLSQTEVDRLLPYVKLASLPALSQAGAPPASLPVFVHAPAKELHIELNATDSTTLELLPGIGPKLAARILSFRDKLGGFYSIDQVGETYGLPDSTFQIIKTHLSLGNLPVRTLNINLLPAAQLQQHPYLRWNLANAIVRYRQQHGNFTSKEDLLQIAAITPDLFRKLSPYVSTE